MTSMQDRAAREALRHTVATLAYRSGKPLREAPATFGAFRAGESTRTPSQILAHMCDLFDWALSLAEGPERWHESNPGAWDADVARWFTAVARVDAYLASDAPLACTTERLFQGPVADALTHVGQLALLRRLAGSPIRGENYSKAQIVAGRVGAEQATPRREFD